jgi:hypothetical protein
MPGSQRGPWSGLHIMLVSGATAASGVRGRARDARRRSSPPARGTRGRAAPKANESLAKEDAPLDELQGVARVRLLVMRNPRAALAVLDRLAHEQPRGYFLEERAPPAILALAADGQHGDAARRAKQFAQAHPNSPFIDRVRLATSFRSRGDPGASTP